MIDFENNAAFNAFEELLVWQQDRASKLRGSFRATVLQGAAGTNGAGASTGPVPADAYSIVIDFRSPICGQVSVGDTIKRSDGTIFTVHQISREHGIGAVLRVTCEERPER